MAVQSLEIIGWQPTPVNILLRANRFARARMLARDAEMVTLCAQEQRVTQATRPRRVTFLIRFNRRTRSGLVDPDALYKSGLDALVHAKLLLNDDPDTCELGTPLYEACSKKGIVFILEDL